MNDETEPGDSRIEQVNQLVRAIVVLAFTGGIVYGFVVSKVVSTESFLVIGSVVFTWWFKSRDDEKKRANGAASSPGQPSSEKSPTP